LNARPIETILKLAGGEEAAEKPVETGLALLQAVAKMNGGILEAHQVVYLTLFEDDPDQIEHIVKEQTEQKTEMVLTVLSGEALVGLFSGVSSLLGRLRNLPLPKLGPAKGVDAKLPKLGPAEGVGPKGPVPAGAADAPVGRAPGAPAEAARPGPPAAAE